MKLSNKDVEEELYQAREFITIAMTHIQQASTSHLGFSLSRPLNILYKELDSHRQLLQVYLGERKIEGVSLDVAEPQSWKAYKNMNVEVSHVQDK
jgi:hypothetical protein